jgi:hypothetical protein
MPECDNRTYVHKNFAPGFAVTDDLKEPKEQLPPNTAK